MSKYFTKLYYLFFSLNSLYKKTWKKIIFWLLRFAMQFMRFYFSDNGIKLIDGYTRKLDKSIRYNHWHENYKYSLELELTSAGLKIKEWPVITPVTPFIVDGGKHYIKLKRN